MKEVKAAGEESGFAKRLFRLRAGRARMAGDVAGRISNATTSP
jgi:hypothetical protein